jgi:hypothetical protein
MNEKTISDRSLKLVRLGDNTVIRRLGGSGPSVVHLSVKQQSSEHRKRPRRMSLLGRSASRIRAELAIARFGPVSSIARSN